MGLIVILVAVLAGCASTTLSPHERQQQKQQLQGVLQGLSSAVDPDEARRLANTLVDYSVALKSHYGIDTGPVVHNMLVNAGVKERGLCIHWTRDLLAKIKSLRLSSFQLYWAQAYRDERFRLEHNAPVIAARGQPFAQGLVLDGWRHSGQLAVVPVREDRYPWRNQSGKYCGAACVP